MTYPELAIGFDGAIHDRDESTAREDITVAALLEILRGAVGKTFEGWKGGDFLMSEKTPL